MPVATMHSSSSVSLAMKDLSDSKEVEGACSSSIPSASSSAMDTSGDGDASNKTSITSLKRPGDGLLAETTSNSTCSWRQRDHGDSRAGSSTVLVPRGPDKEKLESILMARGYVLDVTGGQRKYGPPIGSSLPEPGPGCELFVGKIPKDVFEDELIPIFERVGVVYNLRLMMDPATAVNRGFCFVTYADRSTANRAVRELDGYELSRGKTLKVNISDPNVRLFVGNIPKSKGKDEILEEFRRITVGLADVIIYSSPDDKKKNRGFAFLEYDSHKSASQAKRKLSSGRIKVWGLDIIVDWADPQEEPDPEIMSKVKVLYVRNLTQKVTEEELRALFEKYGAIERVKKIKDYAFVHFAERDHAIRAMRELSQAELGGAPLEVNLAKPPSDKKKKEDMLRRREMRMMHVMGARPIDMIPTANSNPNLMGTQPMGVGGRLPPVRRGASNPALLAGPAPLTRQDYVMSGNPPHGALITAPAAGPTAAAWGYPYTEYGQSIPPEYGVDTYFDAGGAGGGGYYDPSAMYEPMTAAAYYDYYSSLIDSFYRSSGGGGVMDTEDIYQSYSGSESWSSRSGPNNAPNNGGSNGARSARRFQGGSAGNGAGAAGGDRATD